ncbi:MAG: hypothetical protein ACI3VN_09345 [Candidatus Onthomonas sp.]
MNGKLDYLLPGSTLEEIRGKWDGVRYYAVIGGYRGYDLILEPGTGTQGKRSGLLHVVINTSIAGQAQQESLNRFLIQLSQGRKDVALAKTENHSVQLDLRAALNRKKIETVINPVVDQVVRYLEQQQISAGCQGCGKAVPLDCYAVNGFGYYLCPDCAAQLEQELREAQAAAREQRSCLLPGLVGALLGGLIGVAVWFGLYQLGYIAALGGLTIAAAACKGYELLGKGMDWKGVAVCCICVLLLTGLTNHLCWIFLTYRELSDLGWTFSDANTYFWDVLAACDLTGAYLGELAIGCLFAFLGSFGVLGQSLRRASGSYFFRKYERTSRTEE